MPKGSGPFSLLASTGLRIGTGQRSMDRSTACGGRSLTRCRKAAPVLADGMPCTICGCSSIGRARPRLWPRHGFETRHSLYFGCVLALRSRMTWCWRCGMCVAIDQAPCSETPRPTGRSRSGTAEVDLCRVRLDGRGHHSFKVGARVRIPHATPANRNPVELTLRGGNRPQRLGGAGTRDRMDLSGGVAQHPAEQPPCKRQAAGSNPVTSTNATSLR